MPQTGVLYAVNEGATVVYRSLEQMRATMASLESLISTAQGVNLRHFKDFSSKLHTVQEGIGKLQVLCRAACRVPSPPLPSMTA